MFTEVSKLPSIMTGFSIKVSGSVPLAFECSRDPIIINNYYSVLHSKQSRACIYAH